MKFELKLSFRVERSDALDRALRKQGFEVVSDDLSETSVEVDEDASEPFGFFSKRISS